MSGKICGLSHCALRGLDPVLIVEAQKATDVGEKCLDCEAGFWPCGFNNFEPVICKT